MCQNTSKQTNKNDKQRRFQPVRHYEWAHDIVRDAHWEHVGGKQKRGFRMHREPAPDDDWHNQDRRADLHYPKNKDQKTEKSRCRNSADQESDTRQQSLEQ